MLNLDIAVVYDVEVVPNCFTLNAIGLYSDLDLTFEVSQYRDHREQLFQWFWYWHQTATPMVGFNNVAYDYSVIHEFWLNPYISNGELYEHSQMLIGGAGRFATVYASDRFAPQVDVFKVHHFDNRAKSTSLKALQVNMRSATVLEMPLPFDQPLTEEQIRDILIPYNKHDVRETKKFAHISMDAIRFRNGLAGTVRGDVINWNDSKIGSKILEQRLGAELCYDQDRQPRQTPRERIALADIIFPYIQFRHPEFVRVLEWMRGQTLAADELSETIRTKGVFTGVRANVGGLDFYFGTGGIHGSVSSQRFIADDEWAIRDIDVASLYPNIAIVNRLYPEHLGARFVEEYSKLPAERKEWQARKGKKSVEANSLKLAANGTYGNSNNRYSVFYDPKFTMSITINGQLLLCMLAEWLLSVPSVQIIQVNTDGITYRIRRDQLATAAEIEKAWQRYTLLTLEDAEYRRMWIRDVNSYIGESLDGTTLKQKGAYWYPRVFPDDISNAQPPAWHKDFSAQVVIMAAVEHMVAGADIDRYIHGHGDPFDFMCRAKVDRSSRLMIGDREVQRICRYYVSTNGGEMRKISPPAGPEGAYKRRSGLTDAEYWNVASTLAPGVWDERIHTKNRSRYETRTMAIEAGYRVTDCSVAANFDFGNLNYDWYVEQAKKLVIA